MVTATNAFSTIPGGLRTPLVDEFNSIIRNYVERRWGPAELSAGKFCEIVYTILEGFGSTKYAPSPAKPTNFVAACRSLETRTGIPRSFQILIPRMLPTLYEIRNNRGVGHVGGDVDPNEMDASAVLCMTTWIMAELARVFHDLPIADAQHLVDSLVERKTPLIWQSGNVLRVLKPDLPLKDQLLLLLFHTRTPVGINDLLSWTECSERSYLKRILRSLHNLRYIEMSSDDSSIEILPPGSQYADQLMAKLAKIP